MKKKRHIFVKCLLGLIVILFCTAAAVGIFFAAKGYMMYRGAISERSIKERVSDIRSEENFTPYSELSEFYINAVISVEDRRFEKHRGIDIIAVVRALWTDIRTLSFAEGGSTITQQTAKNILFTREKKLERKAAEVYAAFALEYCYDKNEIFELYVNTAYFGSGYYGIYNASMGYYKKPPSELSPYEAAMLAGVINAPSVYSPDENIGLAKQRVSQVLERMVENGVITKKKADEIINGAE
ncbi:MAG: transglycosylase domain-containing protein [Oscillospiraceae bacterium]|nr:transglycosylase domain-containing protein [Oscillospiraceae bacterium]